jgi:glutaredoxin
MGGLPESVIPTTRFVMPPVPRAQLIAALRRRTHHRSKEVILPKTDMVLYQAEWCAYCARVRAKMTDLLLTYTIVNVPSSHSERHEVQKVSNQTGIPVLVDGETVLDDDDEIIPYLEKKYGKAS